MIIAGLVAVLIVILVLPFCIKKVEHNIEIFLFAMGIVAVLFTRQMSWHLGEEALKDPIPITIAVLIFGLGFKLFRRQLDKAVKLILRKVSIASFIFFLIAVLGGISSVITAIIAALILVEIVSMLRLDKRHEIIIVILACFSIGMGAALTPIGEPLSTIAIAKLKSWPHVNFWYLAKLLGGLVALGILIMSVLSLFFKGRHSESTLVAEHREESYLEIALRTGKVYLFVVALVLLGQGFKPMIDAYVVRMPGDALYWINMISAILDNATLTAAEVSPAMTELQVKEILMGLLIAGGMLIPGNIPNIIAASKLKIGSRDWAKYGVPIGLAMMAVIFAIMKIIH